MKILIAETSWAAMAAGRELAGRDIGVVNAADGEELCFLAEITEPTAVLLDTKLPGMAYTAAARKLRSLFPNIGLVGIDREESAEVRARALDAGFDDVVPEAADAREVVARILAVVRRRAGHAVPQFEIGDLRLDMSERAATVRGTPMRLSRLEYRLLEYLALGLGAVRSKDAILTHLYDLRDEPDPRTIDAYVCRIRAEITRLGGDPGLLRTVWGRGYTMAQPGDARAAA